MNDTLLMIFIGVSTLAIVLQACILVAMYVATKKTSDQVEKLATEVRTKALPAVETVQTMIVDNKDRVEEIIENLAAASSSARAQLARIDSTLNDVLDRTRLQVMRADELATATMDQIEATTQIVQHTIVTPVRRLNGVLSGLSAGLGMFVGTRRVRKNGPKAGLEQEDMFI